MYGEYIIPNTSVCSINNTQPITIIIYIQIKLLIGAIINNNTYNDNTIINGLQWFV